MGSKGMEEIKNHPFLDGVNWTNIQQNEIFYVPERNNDLEEDRVLRKSI